MLAALLTNPQVPDPSRIIDIRGEGRIFTVIGQSRTVSPDHGEKSNVSAGNARTYFVFGDSRTATIPGESRTVDIPEEPRTVTIPGDNRTVDIPEEPRTVTPFKILK